MIQEILYYRSKDFNPRRNQALEAYFTEIAEPGRPIFYLWQNDKVVFIGRNQSARGECQLGRLEADGGFLCRRLSGGGAVYHDKANINFTFAVHEDDYDTLRQTEVILNAVRRLGLRPERTGRNDLTVNGRKFSGHSYYKNKTQRFHNGTLLVNTDTEAMQRYLAVNKAKLQKNKVKSVRSRVLNLRELLPDLSIEDLLLPLKEALREVYQADLCEIEEKDLDASRIQYWLNFFSDPAWLYGDQQEGLYKTEERFAWGQVSLDFNLDAEGRIADLNLYSDGIEASYLSKLSAKLEGLKPEQKILAEALDALPAPDEGDIQNLSMHDDLAGLLARLPGLI